MDKFRNTTRGTYRNSIPTPPTIDLAYLKSYWEKPKERKRSPVPTPTKEWEFAINFSAKSRHGGIVVANTRSEARALIKSFFRLRRIPVGVEIVAR